MMPKKMGVYAVLGAAVLGGCSTVPQPSSRAHLTSPLFSKPPEADAFSAVLIARYAALTDDPGEAVSRYASVLDDLPDGDPIAVRGVFAALMSGDFEQAVEFAEKADAGTPGSASSLSTLTLAVKALSSGREEQAQRLIAQGEYGPFNQAMARHIAAWVALERDGLEAAEAIMANGQGDGFDVHTVRLAMVGLLQLSAGEDARARETFVKLDAIGPRLAISTEAHARLLASSGARDEALAMLASFRDEIGINPQLAALQREIAAGNAVKPPRLSAKAGAALGIYAPAAALAARSDSDLPGVYFALALELDPGLDIARTLWADRLDQSGRHAEAIAVLDAVPTSSPFYATAQGQRAWALARSGQGDAALDGARAAIVETGDRDLKVQYGDLLMSQGHLVAADRVLTDLIDDDAARGLEDWRLLFARGTAREQIGNWAEAEADLTRALDLAPDNPDIMNHLGAGWAARQHNLNLAVPMLERAARFKPHSGAVIDSLGWAYFQVGRYEDAIAQLEYAVELNPTSAATNDHLGDAYWRVGRHLEATFQWERALAQAPGSARADTLRRKLVAGLPPQTGALVGASLGSTKGMAVQP